MSLFLLPLISFFLPFSVVFILFYYQEKRLDQIITSLLIAAIMLICGIIGSYTSLLLEWWAWCLMDSIISALLFLADIIILIMHFYSKRSDSEVEDLDTNEVNSEFTNNSQESMLSCEQINNYYEEPRWEELSSNEKKVYLDNAMRELFISQIDDPYYEMDKKTLSAKRMALKMNVFIYEDLTKEEKNIVEHASKEKYIEKQNVDSYAIQNNTKSTKKGLSKLAKSMIIIPIVWFVLFIAFMVISTNMGANLQLAVIFAYLSIFIYSLGGIIGLFESIGAVVLILRYVKRNK